MYTIASQFRFSHCYNSVKTVLTVKEEVKSPTIPPAAAGSLKTEKPVDYGGDSSATASADEGADTPVPQSAVSTELKPSDLVSAV